MKNLAQKYNHWTDDFELSRSNLNSLLSNEIGTIRIKNFASLDECESLLSAISDEDVDFYQNVDPPIGRIGITQFEANKHNKDWYFENAHRQAAVRNKLFSKSFDPLNRLMKIINALCGFDVGIASEDDYGEYYAGLVREISQSARLHADFAPLDAPGWSIGNVDSQLTWNLFVKAPKVGGECVVYNRLWCQQDEQLKSDAHYGYPHNIVSRCESKVIKPEVGELVLFNPRNFHEVMLASDSRFTVSSFVGKNPEGNLVFWS